MTSLSSTALTTDIKVMVRWVNYKTNDPSLEIDSLEPLSDGVILLGLLKALARDVPFSSGMRMYDKPLTHEERTSNVHSCLMHMTKMGVDVGNLRPDYIATGKMGALEGVVWCLIVRFEVHPLLRRKKVFFLANLCELTMRYVDDKIRMVNTNGIVHLRKFPRDFRDGKALCLFVATKAPISIPPKLYKRICAGQASPEEALGTAIRVAERVLGVPMMMQPDEAVQASELAYLVYVTIMCNIFKDIKGQVLEKDDPEEDALIKDLRAKIASFSIDNEVSNKQNEELSSELHFLRSSFELERKQLKEIVSQRDEELADARASMHVLEEEIQTLRNALAGAMEQCHNGAKEIAVLADELAKEEAAALERRQAPPTGRIALMFTDVQDSTLQWEANPEVMLRALELHNDTIRRVLGNTKGYEVKTEGDSFMVAFQSMSDCVEAACTIQLELMKARWPEKLLHENASSAILRGQSGRIIFRGFRVRMGLHWGTPLAKIDPVTGRTDFFGPVVNAAARIEGVAHGGQIVISDKGFQEIESRLHQLAGHPEATFLGEYELRGVKMRVAFHELKSAELRERTFPPLRTSAPEKKPLPPKMQAALRGAMKQVANQAKTRKMAEMTQHNKELRERLAELTISVENATMTSAALTTHISLLGEDAAEVFPEKKHPEASAVKARIDSIVAEQKRMAGTLAGLTQENLSLKAQLLEALNRRPRTSGTEDPSENQRETSARIVRSASRPNSRPKTAPRSRGTKSMRSLGRARSEMSGSDESGLASSGGRSSAGTRSSYRFRGHKAQQRKIKYLEDEVATLHERMKDLAHERDILRYKVEKAIPIDEEVAMDDVLRHQLDHRLDGLYQTVVYARKDPSFPAEWLPNLQKIAQRSIDGKISLKDLIGEFSYTGAEDAELRLLNKHDFGEIHGESSGVLGVDQISLRDPKFHLPTESPDKTNPSTLEKTGGLTVSRKEDTANYSAATFLDGFPLLFKTPSRERRTSLPRREPVPPIGTVPAPTPPPEPRGAPSPLTSARKAV